MGLAMPNRAKSSLKTKGLMKKVVKIDHTPQKNETPWI
jgi:hypothetical protein